MVKKIQMRIKKMTLKSAYTLSAVILVISTFFVYYFSFDAKVHVLACTGNYYLSDKQVYDLAMVTTNTRMWLTPNLIYSNRIEKMPLIDSVQVYKSQGKLRFNVKEKVVVGYYEKNNKKYLLTDSNESIPLDKQYEKIIVHVPLLNGFNAKQRKQICAQFKEHSRELTRGMIEKIAEMTPYKTSFDKNMIKMTMQDGNSVYTSMNSLVMMSKYQAMLTQLKGKSVCLLLDASSSAIEKVKCSDIDPKKKTVSKTKKKEKTNSTEKNTSSSTNAHSDQWVLDAATGLQYNASTGYYRDPSTLQEYMWNSSTQSFDPVYNGQSATNATTADETSAYDQNTYNTENTYASYDTTYGNNETMQYPYQ